MIAVSQKMKRFLYLSKRAVELLVDGQFVLFAAAVRSHFRSAVGRFRQVEYFFSDSEGSCSAEQWDTSSEQVVDTTCSHDRLSAIPSAPLEYFHPQKVPIKQHRNETAFRPLVSVVIPCFNYGPFVHEAIESVLAQTFIDIEIIVVEGGSTDNETRRILRELDRPRTRVLYQEMPTLVGANRNFGIENASGRYVCCLDADDTLEPTYLEKAVYLLENHAYDVVSTGLTLFGAQSRNIGILELPTLFDMTIGNHVATCGVFRRELWKTVGGYFDTGKGKDHVAEDWDFWLRVAATGARIRNISGESLFNYRTYEGGSLSSDTNVRSREKQRAAILERNAHLLTSCAFSRSNRESARKLSAKRTPKTLVNYAKNNRRSLLIAVPFLLVGGAERLLSSLLKHLVMRGWHVTVVSTLPQDGLPDASDWFRKHTSEVYMLPRFLDEWQRASFLHYLLSSRRFDALLIAGSKLVYDQLPIISRAHLELAIVDLLFNTVGHTHSHATYISEITFAIGENRDVIEWYKSKGWLQNSVRLVESGLDLDGYQQERPVDLASRLGIAADDIVIGFAGRLSSEKAPEIFLKIAASFSDEPRAHFVMIGDGPLRKAIQSQIKSLPLGTRLTFLGHQSPKEYFALYDIFVLPSYLDGRPIALLEALASGCAVVASGVGGIPALLEGTGSGYICRPGDVEEFTQALRKLVFDTSLLKRMKRNAGIASESLLSETQMGDAYIEALEAAITIARQIGNN